MGGLNRRTVLGGALGAPFATLAAPAVHAQSGGKPYNGVSINASCFQTTYYEYLKNYFPEFQEMGLKMIKAQGGIFGWVSDSARILAALS